MKIGQLPDDEEKSASPGEPPPRSQANPESQPKAIKQELKNHEKEKQKPEIKHEPAESKNKLHYTETIKTETTEKKVNQMESYFANMNFLRLLFKWKIHLGVVVLLAVILSAIFSEPAFITPKYKSNAILYPSSLATYSDETPTEQMMQWLESRDIADSVIRKFDLYNYYRIDTSKKYYVSTTLNLFNKNVSISITKYESVNIEVVDEDPEMAYNIVNAIIYYYNNKVTNVHREKYEEVLILEKERLNKKQIQQDSLLKKIIRLRMNYGLIDYGIQSSEVTKGYLGTFDGANMANVNKKEIKKLKSNIESRGDSLLLLTNLMTSATFSLNNYLINYEDAVRHVNKKLTFFNVITSPVVADKNFSPVRGFIVAITALATLFLSFIIIAIVEHYHFVKQKFLT